LSAAFVFDSFMLLAGAVWAHDAWGRYWSWDPLETWSLLTWLGLAILLHLRLTVRLPLAVGWSMAFAVLVIAFLTFFGVPFVSMAPHKGVM
jgi:ABC-type transport system involved in cytochrome c biogenesis permease subunit